MKITSITPVLFVDRVEATRDDSTSEVAESVSRVARSLGGSSTTDAITKKSRGPTCSIRPHKRTLAID
jgi:hypothetical protein